MTSPNDPDKPTSNRHTHNPNNNRDDNDETNPFILFRRFADDQANIFRRFAGDQVDSFSSMFSNMHSDFHKRCDGRWQGHWSSRDENGSSSSASTSSSSSSSSTSCSSSSPWERSSDFPRDMMPLSDGRGWIYTGPAHDRERMQRAKKELEKWTNERERHDRIRPDPETEVKRDEWSDRAFDPAMRPTRGFSSSLGIGSFGSSLPPNPMMPFTDLFGIGSKTPQERQQVFYEMGMLMYIIMSSDSPLKLMNDEKTSGMAPWKEVFVDLVRSTEEEAASKAAPPNEENGLLSRSFRPSNLLSMLQRDEMWDESRKAMRVLEEKPEWGILKSLALMAMNQLQREEEQERSFQHVEFLSGYVPLDGRSWDDIARRNEDVDRDAATELDFYERFLAGNSNDSGFFEKKQQDHQEVDKSTYAPYKPSILSTLTTTERTTQPDGTVITKVILKKRFADGSEETSSSTHTTRDSPQETPGFLDLQTGKPMRLEKYEDAGREKKQEKKGGWFWSSR